MHQASGGDLNMSGPDKAELPRQDPQLLLRFIESDAAPVLVGGGVQLLMWRRLRAAVMKSVPRSRSAASHLDWISAAIARC